VRERAVDGEDDLAGVPNGRLCARLAKVDVHRIEECTFILLHEAAERKQLRAAPGERAGEAGVEGLYDDVVDLEEGW
jgi:hypothetical protein